ncbi:MAG: sulfatase [Vicinamibacteria bacterium]
MKLPSRLLRIAVAVVAISSCRRPLEKPNVVIITLDTTRRDRLGFHGYVRETSPSLDDLAAQSLVFDRAIAASSWTLPSHASIFTGKFPASHGARYDTEGPLRLTQAISGPEEWSHYRASGLSPEETTLAELLEGSGYRTGAIVGGPWMKRVFGLDPGFQMYDDDAISDVNGRLASEVTTTALRFLEEGGEAPFFLFLNYFDPHGPYEAPSPFGGSFGSEIADRYDEEVLYMDHHVGRFLEGMKRLGLFENSLIVVTADHGELLGEHGKMGHGATLFEEEIRVPFLVKYPRDEVAPGRSDSPVHHVDVLPMVLERVGIPAPRGAQGGVPPKSRHPLLAEVVTLEGELSRAFYFGSHKLLWNPLGGHALFDLASDPGEDRDLSETEVERLESAVDLLEKYVASLPSPGESGPETTLDEETLKALRSLGYVP